MKLKMNVDTLCKALIYAASATFAKTVIDYINWKSVNLVANDRELFSRMAAVELKVFGDPVKDDPSDQ